jgi:hypothetical protein
MLATFFTQADNRAGPAPIAGANTAVRVRGVSTAELYTWETPLASYGSFKILATGRPVKDDEYDPEMVALLLRLKARGPVEKFKSADAALERLLPSKR